MVNAEGFSQQHGQARGINLSAPSTAAFFGAGTDVEGGHTDFRIEGVPTQNSMIRSACSARLRP